MAKAKGDPAPAAALYLRVSSDEQVRTLSLDTQERVCRDACDRQGWPVVAVYREEGESAKTADRTELRRALEDLTGRRRRGVTHLVVYDLSRFARSTEDHLSIRGLLRRHGIELVAATQPIQNTPEGRFMETVLAGVAQLDNELRARRVTEGMREAVSRGGWPWQAPLGYLNARDAEGRPGLVLDPDRGPLLRAAFAELAAGGMASLEVLARATRRGLRTRPNRSHGAEPISPQTWSRIVRNPVYTGRVILPAWGMDARGAWEPLVDEVTWRRMQAFLDGKRLPFHQEPRADEHPDFPLRRFVRCSGCGGGLTGAWSTASGGRYGYYFCFRKGCRLVKVPRLELERRFVELLEAIRPPAELAVAVCERAEEVWRERSGRAVATRAALASQREQLQARLTRVEQAYLYEGTIDAEAFRRHRTAVSADLAKLDAELATADDPEASLPEILRAATDLVSRAPEVWAELPPSLQRRFEVALFPDGLDALSGGALRTRGNRSIFSVLAGIAAAEIPGGTPLDGPLEGLAAAAAVLAAVASEAQRPPNRNSAPNRA